nr:MAG: hypothetical protein H1Rhizo271417_000001 [Mitovirus sp.]
MILFGGWTYPVILGVAFLGRWVCGKLWKHNDPGTKLSSAIAFDQPEHHGTVVATSQVAPAAPKGFLTESSWETEYNVKWKPYSQIYVWPEMAE